MDAIEKKIDLYESYLTEDPNNPQLLILLGDMYHVAGKFSLAKTCYNKAIEFQTNSNSAKSRLGNLYLSMGQTRQAERSFINLLDSGENDPVLYHNLAICFFIHGQYEQARQTFESLKDVPLVSRSSNYYLASIDETLDMPEKALDRINTLLKEGDEVYLRGYRASLLYSLDQVEQAISEAKAIVAQYPTNADSWSVLSSMYIESLEHDEAERCVQKVIELAPGDARGWHGLGMIFLQKRDMNNAIKYFQRAIETLPDSSMMLMSLAWAYFCAEQFSESEKAFQAVLEINSNFGEAWGGLACSLVPQNKIDEAQKASRKASALDKNGFASLFAKSLIFKVKGKDQVATDLLSTVLEQEVRPGQPTYIELIERDLNRHNTSIKAIAGMDLDNDK